MMPARSAALLACMLLLAACARDDVALSLPAAFYPVAVAHSPREGAFYIAGLAGGEVMRIAPGEDPRPVRSGEPALRLSVHGGRLWLLTPNSIEARSLHPARADREERALRLDLPAGFAPVDFAIWSEAAAFVLGADGELLRIELGTGRASRFAHLGAPVGALLGAPLGAHPGAQPGARLARFAPADSARAAGDGGASATVPSAMQPAGGRGSTTAAMQSAVRLAAASGALAAFPGAFALLAAHGDALYRIDAQRASVVRVAADAALSGVTQIVRIGDGRRGERIAIFRGHANQVQSATLSRDLRMLTPDLSAGRHDAPFRGAWDGRSLRVLVGRLPHHPVLAGDGRPPLPYRLAQRAAATGAPASDPEVAMKIAPAPR